MRSRRLRLAAAAGLCLFTLVSGAAGGGAAVLAAAPGRASNPAGAVGVAAPGVQTGNDVITMLSQPAWVETSGVFRMELEIAASASSSEQLVVQGYGRLGTRTAFDDALAGRYDTGVRYNPSGIPLSSLPSDPNGGVDVDIPVNLTGAAIGLPEFNAIGGSGVFPLEISLDNASGTQVGQPITTFLVYAAGSAAATEFPPLSVAVVLPVHAPPAVDRSGALAPLPDTDSSDLATLASTLAAYPDVPLSLAVTPETLDALGLGSATDKSTLSELASLARSGPDEVLPSSYVAISPTAMVADGLDNELSNQIRSGASALAGGLDVGPSSGTWVVNGPLDSATLRVLAANGAKRLVVPADELSALPPGYQQYTFASPSQVVGTGVAMPVYGADSLLTADFDNGGGSVLAASQLLAELAMIQLETPGNVRGVAVLPPPGWDVDATFVRTLLAGLTGHPLLKAVTATRLFSAVAPAPVARTLIIPLPAAPSPSVGAGSPASASTTATTVAKTVPPAPLASSDVANIRTARQQLDALDGILGANSPDASRVDNFDRQLLTAESVEIGEGQRKSLVQTVKAQSARILGQISLPSASITLTSTKGLIPLTILAPTSLHATVLLRLKSPRLVFRAFTPASGHCVLANSSTTESCTLLLATSNTTVKIPVETRSSGVFPLEVSLLTPDGKQQLFDHRDTVRSTAVSGVGIVLIVLAVLSLAIWWGRDLHRGRRARQLVPAPDEDSDVARRRRPAEPGAHRRPRPQRPA